MLVSQIGVLNDRFPLKFKQRGFMAEAVILATGLKPIPARYLQGMTVPFTLTFWDQFAIPIGLEDGLSVDRSTTPRPRLARPERSVLDPEEFPDSREPIGGDNPNTQTPLRSEPGTKTYEWEPRLSETRMSERAMANGRCRMHGGASTGPRTAEGWRGRGVRGGSMGFIRPRPWRSKSGCVSC